MKICYWPPIEQVYCGKKVIEKSVLFIAMKIESVRGLRLDHLYNTIFSAPK